MSAEDNETTSTVTSTITTKTTTTIHSSSWSQIYQEYRQCTDPNDRVRRMRKKYTRDRYGTKCGVAVVHVLVEQQHDDGSLVPRSPEPLWLIIIGTEIGPRARELQTQIAYDEWHDALLRLERDQGRGFGSFAIPLRKKYRYGASSLDARPFMMIGSSCRFAAERQRRGSYRNLRVVGGVIVMQNHHSVVASTCLYVIVAHL